MLPEELKNITFEVEEVEPEEYITNCDVTNIEEIRAANGIIKKYYTEHSIIEFDENDNLLKNINLLDNTWSKFIYNVDGYLILMEDSSHIINFIIRDENNYVTNILINDPKFKVTQEQIDRFNNFSHGKNYKVENIKIFMERVFKIS